jgi:hypothetical protein
MLEQLINSLDNRGILVMQAMLGKRSIELLEDQNEKGDSVTVKKTEVKVEKPKLLLPVGP